MIYLKSITLKNFKGVRELTCNFEDLTLLVGLNNSGKTSLLQAVHLLTTTLPEVGQHRYLLSSNIEDRTLNVDKNLAPLGIHNINFLLPYMDSRANSTILGLFSNDLKVELNISGSRATTFFTVSHCKENSEDTLRKLMLEITTNSSEFVTPPGTVSSREGMQSFINFQHQLSQGQGAQLWRNAIWWSVQQEGYESFDAVRNTVSRYFPEVEILQPTLDSGNPPEILLNYKEKNGVKLDMAQSGAGLRTFLTLARLLQQSSANILLLDEPDAHLHGSQQAVVINLLMDTALESLSSLGCIAEWRFL